MPPCSGGRGRRPGTTRRRPSVIGRTRSSKWTASSTTRWRAAVGCRSSSPLVVSTSCKSRRRTCCCWSSSNIVPLPPLRRPVSQPLPPLFLSFAFVLSSSLVGPFPLLFHPPQFLLLSTNFFLPSFDFLEPLFLSPSFLLISLLLLLPQLLLQFELLLLDLDLSPSMILLLPPRRIRPSTLVLPPSST